VALRGLRAGLANGLREPRGERWRAGEAAGASPPRPAAASTDAAPHGAARLRVVRRGRRGERCWFRRGPFRPAARVRPISCRLDHPPV